MSTVPDLDTLPSHEATNVILDRLQAHAEANGLSKVEDIFKQIDRDGSGIIDAKDLSIALEAVLSPPPKLKVIRAFIAELGKKGDNDGFLDYNELIKGIKSRPVPKLKPKVADDVSSSLMSIGSGRWLPKALPGLGSLSFGASGDDTMPGLALDDGDDGVAMGSVPTHGVSSNAAKPAPQKSSLSGSFAGAARIKVMAAGVARGRVKVNVTGTKAFTALEGALHSLKDADVDLYVSHADRFAYVLENFVAAEPGAKFYVLLGLALTSCIILGAAWHHSLYGNGGWYHVGETMYLAFQVLTTAGYDDSNKTIESKIAFFLLIITGVTLVAILIGLITEAVNAYMQSLSLGTTKVVERGHVLILGYEQSTARVVCQIAFLRRVYHALNRRGAKRFFPWLRASPSTPIADAPVVILSHKPKQEVEAALSATLAERGVTTRDTKLGRDVVVRCGDPCSAHDLVRVAAHDAVAVLVMMAEKDEEEKTFCSGTAANSATLRCLLALRNVLYGGGDGGGLDPKLRVVCQLSSPCKFIRATSFASPDGKPFLAAFDLARVVNVMLFHCAAAPGLARVYMELLNFDGCAFRTRASTELAAGPDGAKGWCVGKTVRECLAECNWHDGILVGFDAVKNNFYDPKNAASILAAVQMPGASGIMGDPDRVVLATDSAIFVSTTSSPTLGSAHLNAKHRTAAKKSLAVVGEQQRLAKRANSFYDVDADPKNVLVCGWRGRWDKDHTLLTSLVEEMSRGIPPGSTITFLNVKTTAGFGEIMQHDHFSETTLDRSLSDILAGHHDHGWCSDEITGVTVLHFSADPCLYEQVEPLLRDRHFDSAICIGTVVGQELPAASRDSRILTMLLILRDLTAGNDRPTHVVAENELDQTSGLALAPPRGSEGHLPDFVNTQAIIARTLVMSLAYPQIQDAISDLITTHEATANIAIVSAAALGLTEDRGPLAFGAVAHLVLEVYKFRGVAVGYLTLNDLYLVPSLDEEVTWTESHRIVCFLRRLAQDPALPPASVEITRGVGASI